MLSFLGNYFIILAVTISIPDDFFEFSYWISFRDNVLMDEMCFIFWSASFSSGLNTEARCATNNLVSTSSLFVYSSLMFFVIGSTELSYFLNY